MLFPALDDVPRFWKAVVEATVSGNLGIAAKIATGTDLGRDPTYRLICVYTKDFSDVDDVRRVAQGLLDRGLIAGDGSGRPSYYKPDIYTDLGIDSGNSYGLRASLYNSHEVLRLYTDPKKSRPPDDAQPAKKKQRTLEAFGSGAAKGRSVAP